MDAGAAPVSLKGTREPLLLIATGAFLGAFSVIPLVGVISGAGLAMGAHGLRNTDAGRCVPTWRRLTIASGWVACVFGAAMLGWIEFGLYYFAALLIALLVGATMIGRIASEAGDERLASLVAFARIGLVTALPLLVAFSPSVSLIEWVASSIWFAVLVLALRTKALPYGKRPLRGSHA